MTGCATTQRLLGMGHLAMATVKKCMNAQLVRVQNGHTGLTVTALCRAGMERWSVSDIAVQAGNQTVMV